ncbi:NfeD-like C-terminal, partner-binding [Alteribacillus persepolensis]|uniref:NfeD-like C-terminal, partner-binding n=1 Tax=Alteribacillus persepolensis TaxID=568899 RepID=A0A1G8CUD4_9BACI|nr:NfeD family protein [Alteribacillus persepolensis]SDH49122.1 NfeD-like C-terminal, partner-binding [Alteribacillus persepolensis]
MELLQHASIGFFIVFFGTVFLTGELLVKAKGLFAVLGIAFMSLYFSYHIDSSAGLWILILYGVGLSLIIVDGKVISDGTIALLGALLMGLGLAVPTPSITYAILVVFGFILGMFAAGLFLKVFPRRKLWSKITLRDRMSGDLGYNSMNETYTELKGREGKTLTPFRPIGTIMIDGNEYSATSGGQWLEADEEVVVTDVDGTRILVKRKEQVKEKEEELDT